MNRRQFMTQTGMASAAALLAPAVFSAVPAPKYKMGLQLFTIRANMAKDPLGSLKAARDMGYEDLEIYGFDSTKGSYYGFKAAEFKKILGDLGLTASSGHYDFAPFLNQTDDALHAFVDRCIEGAKAAGMQYITWPWLAPDQRSLAHFRLLAKKLNLIGQQVSDAGLGFAYHNHDFEFREQDGQTGYDIILKETDPALVKLQMDLYWVMHSSKRSPKEWVRNQPGRYVMWHIKDMDKVTRDYTELGNGSIDYTMVLPDPAESGLKFYYLEQGGNFAQAPMKSIADSAAYFKKHLQRFL
ncbi:sugar phosphate isomerase/epimerase family protein [Sediminibacterium soli]|uniref:sugar phosphate isomerase/epimerase family protein n=1 Tax=Sediminibacterium soli TaxID=2698829 RepID=UPI00137A685F|nr:sugar phosphate isomerase/epimerase [Sediminibacterium soli]NCI46547.1 sugar phosphate isomerase/epimerase [Sediminibacterium soli]